MLQFKSILYSMIDSVYLKSFDSKYADHEESKKMKQLIQDLRSLFIRNGSREDRASMLYQNIRKGNEARYISLKSEFLSSGCTVVEFETKFKTLLTQATTQRFCRYLMRGSMKFEAIEA